VAIAKTKRSKYIVVDGAGSTPFLVDVALESEVQTSQPSSVCNPLLAMEFHQ
jgi:hypothetical protein